MRDLPLFVGSAIVILMDINQLFDPDILVTAVFTYAIVGFGLATGWHTFAMIVNLLSMGCEAIAKAIGGKDYVAK